MTSHARSLVLLLSLAVMVAAFGSSDDRFLKKYAMMKIYESCFGVDVVREIRQEMKAACLKCAAPPEPEVQQQSSQPQNIRIPPSFGHPGNVYTRLGEGVSQDANLNEIPVQISPAAPPQISGEQPAFDIKKLHQAIYSYRQQQPYQQAAFQSVPSYDQYQSPYGMSPFQQPYIQPWAPQPYIPPFQAPLYQPSYQFYGNRISRDMDFKNSLELLTSRTSGKVRNVTCVMQELGYLDYNLEPNYEKISERIANLPIHKDLKSDMQDGLQFCQQFAQCVPDTRRENSPLSRELVKPMFFFKCYKHKKLEACIMKDVRDRFATEGEFDTETDFRSISRAGRAMKGKKTEGETTKSPIDNTDEMSAVLYDFLYGGADLDQDSFF